MSQEDNKCDNFNIVKNITSYFNRHYKQATIIVIALSIGFLMAVTVVCYATYLQVKNGCLTFFIKQNVKESNLD